jgi:hypothetical protein
MGRIESSNKERENDRSLVSYESPPDPFPQPRRKRSSSPQDEDYISEEEVYEH